MNESQNQISAPQARPHLFARLLHFLFGGRRSSTLAFLAAITASAIGAATWLINNFNSSAQDTSLPRYVPLAVSFAGGFLIGRIVRGFAKTAALIASIALAAIILSTHLTADQEINSAIKQDATWVREHLTHAKTHLLRLLPSTAGAALGAFFGSRKPRPRDLEGP